MKIKFSKLFNPYLAEGAVYSFIHSMIEESKPCIDIMKKELGMTKNDDEDFKNSTKCWICDYAYLEGDVKLRDNCHITGKYRDSANRNCNINVKLNHKIPIVLHNLKNYGSHLIMQEVGIFNFEINVLPIGLEKIHEL